MPQKIIASQYEIGKKLYHDWKHCNYDTHMSIRNIGVENIDKKAIMRGFCGERMKFVQDDENNECFYGAMDEVGVQYWAD